MCCAWFQSHGFSRGVPQFLYIDIGSSRALASGVCAFATATRAAAARISELLAIASRSISSRVITCSCDECAVAGNCPNESAEMNAVIAMTVDLTFPPSPDGRAASGSRKVQRRAFMPAGNRKESELDSEDGITTRWRG